MSVYKYQDGKDDTIATKYKLNRGFKPLKY